MGGARDRSCALPGAPGNVLFQASGELIEAEPFPISDKPRRVPRAIGARQGGNTMSFENSRPAPHFPQ